MYKQPSDREASAREGKAGGRGATRMAMRTVKKTRQKVSGVTRVEVE